MKRREMIGSLVAAAAGSVVTTTSAQTVPPSTESKFFSRPDRAQSPEGATVLVTGSNRGIGLGFVKGLLARGVKRVYATGRNPDNLPAVVALDPDRVVALTLDVNVPEQREAVAEAATDVTWLINNAGIGGSEKPEERRILSASSLDNARFVMETNCWSPAELARLFTPIILDNGGGAIVNMLSVGAWYCVPAHATYSMSKAAAALMTAGLRAELFHEPVLVSGIFTAGVITYEGDPSGIPAIDHAFDVFDAMARGETDIVAGSGSERIRDEVRADPQAVARNRIEGFYASQESNP